MTQPSLRFGSAGEHQLQLEFGTAERAADFYDRQVRPQLTLQMREFIARQTMVFLSTADADGACDASFRAGPPGFVQVLDDHTLAYPEYKGNGVLASAGNISENPHLGLLFLDFSHDHIGLHVNGTAHLRPDSSLRSAHPELPFETAPGRRVEFWIHLSVDEAYIHCSKHIPHLVPAPRSRPQTERPKDADYFTGEPVARRAPAALETPEEPQSAARPSWSAAPTGAGSRRSWRWGTRRRSSSTRGRG
ncbi:pyridoxamine 5'-phosphate oxidase family protein [Kitasatospora azatica]|uniref:pyridoxamine 5'-phosphate oxidase family protein n=1 Tax=Kitasatospora azatica TaxID=58347 RepID=UPI000A02A1AF|nr:pyridoxamine 5'-phosphate oxidase family protein [Kitasatospora azatica]